MDNDEIVEGLLSLSLFLGGMMLFVWSWYATGSFLAALIVTTVGGFVLLLFLGPVIAFIFLLLAVVLDIIWSLGSHR